MEQIFTYLLKSSSLIAIFFLAYYFLVRKETFFNSNRWFLLAGLFTSVLMPLWFFKKIVVIEKPNLDLQYLENIPQQSLNQMVATDTFSKIDWQQLFCFGYILVCIILFLKIISDFVSLFLLLKNKQSIDNKQFKFIDLPQNIAPFSFFKYIVYNSSLYSNDELQRILSHEKVHCQEQHSVDVMIAKLFCVLFWFNPFVWLYKNAIIQNLEFIADKKAIHNIEDKKAYQMTLLRVVTDQNCLSIVNLFHQPDLSKGESLIKKRIIMLNKNQSKRKNALKYAMVIPVLIAFMLLFQVKVVAQEKENDKVSKSSSSNQTIMRWTKNSADSELKNDVKELDKQGITIKYSKLKRNKKGEITGIKVEYKTKEGFSGVSETDGDEPIKPLIFYKIGNKTGFGNLRNVTINYHSDSNKDEKITEISEKINDSILDSLDELAVAEIPEIHEVAVVPTIPAVPAIPAISVTSSGSSKIVIQRDDEEPTVIINGKFVEGSKSVAENYMKNRTKSKGEGYSYSYSSSDGTTAEAIISRKEIEKIRKNAEKDARNQIKKMRPEILRQAKRDAEMAQRDSEVARRDSEIARQDIEQSRKDFEQAKMDMEQAKADMMQAKKEMEQAKAEFEKQKAELKSQSK